MRNNKVDIVNLTTPSGRKYLLHKEKTLHVFVSSNELLFWV